MGKIAVHPVLNRLPINFKNEIAINCFIGILKEFNYQAHKGMITIKKKDLWKMAKIKDEYREDVAKELIKELAHPQHIPYKVGENSYRITGSVFIFQEDEYENLK
ncbi:MAG: hypothetical protein ACRDAS_04210, partial [Cetobacterium sp.]